MKKKLKTCFKCKDKGFCSVLCRDMENFLEREQSKEGYSSRQIRRKEIPYNSEGIALLEQYDVDKMRGKPKK